MPNKLTEKEALLANLIAKYTHDITSDKTKIINDIKNILKKNYE